MVMLRPWKRLPPWPTWLTWLHSLAWASLALRPHLRPLWEDAKLGPLLRHPHLPCCGTNTTTLTCIWGILHQVPGQGAREVGLEGVGVGELPLTSP